jgi:hypothetical protein
MLAGTVVPGDTIAACADGGKIILTKGARM